MSESSENSAAGGLVFIILMIVVMVFIWNCVCRIGVAIERGGRPCQCQHLRAGLR